MKNDVIKTLINRCSHCKHDALRVNSDDRNVSVNNNSASDILDCDEQFSVNVAMDRDKNVIDDRYVTSRTTDRMRRIHENKNADEVRSSVEHDDDRLMSVVIIGDSMLNNINPRGISKYENVNVKHFSGLNSESMKDYIQYTPGNSNLHGTDENGSS